jgi:hypothetical protein
MEEKIPNGIPPLDGSNFEYWSNRMETYLKSLGEDVWFSVSSGYNALKKPKTAAQKEAKRNNKLAIDTSEIQGGIMCIIKRDLGQATRPLCKGRQKKKKKLKQITTSQISKKKIEVSSFALIVKE